MLRTVAEAFACRRERGPERRRIYYDTFDRRLLAAGQSFWTEGSGGRRILRWQDRSGAHRLGPGSPGSARELPDGPWRRRLEHILGPRRLLPLLELRRREETLHLLDGEEKTVARLRLTSAAARAAGRKGRLEKLPPRLTALPLRGYAKAFRRLLRPLEAAAGLEEMTTGLLAEALAATDLESTPYRSKPRLAFDPSERADAAAKRLLRALLDVMLANEEGTRADLDPEFLHDFRVALRRSRSVLGQIKGIFPRPTLRRFRRELSWLGSATGPTRDLDVHLLKMPDYETELSEEDRRHLRPLRRYLKARHVEEQRLLVRHLASARYRRLIAGWSAFLARPVPARTSLPNAPQPIAEVARRRTRKIYKRVLREGLAIHAGTPDAEVHALRIDCKKLRYLLELFASLYPRDALGPFLKALKGLQENLGDFNDYSVQREALEETARSMQSRGEAPAETLMAMGRLAAHLEAGQKAERHRVEARFAAFADEETRVLFQRLWYERPRRC